MRIAIVLAAALSVAGAASAQTIRVTIDPAAAAGVVDDAIRAIAGHAGALEHLEPRQNYARSRRRRRIARRGRWRSARPALSTSRPTPATSPSPPAAGATRRSKSFGTRGRTDADVQQGLDQVKVSVDQRPDRARVRAVYPDRQATAYSIDVSYVITAPAGTHVTAETISGSVTIKGIRGSGQRVDVTSGDVNIAGSRVSQAKTISGPVTLTDVETDGTVDVRSVSGTVTLQNVKARRLTADAVASGDITARNIVCDAATLKTLSGNVDFSGPLSKNGRYELGAFSGTVHFAPAGPAGFELQASTFSGDIRTDKSMTFRDLSLSRRSLRGTVGDGGAMVILKTFSGNVTIGK